MSPTAWQPASHTRPNAPAARAVPTAQVLLGMALLARPKAIAHAVAGAAGATPPSWVTRTLGARLVTQGAALLARPDPALARLSAAVDATHAASMLLVAAVSSRYRRTALISAAVAAGTGAATAQAR